MVSMIVGRLHVSATNREVVAAIRNSLRKKVRKGVKHRADRKALYRAAIDVHAANRKLYVAVVSGRI